MNNKITQKQRAALYLRAAHDRDGKAVSRQRAAYEQFMRANNIPAWREYADIGSGLRSNCSGLTRMLVDLEQQRDFSTVVVWDMARLARNHVDLTRILVRLRELNIRVLVASSSEEIHDKEIFVLGLQAVVGQWASEEKGVRG